MAHNSSKPPEFNSPLFNVGVQKLEQDEKPDDSNQTGPSNNQISLNLNVINHCKIISETFISLTEFLITFKAISVGQSGNHRNQTTPDEAASNDTSTKAILTQPRKRPCCSPKALTVAIIFVINLVLIGVIIGMIVFFKKDREKDNAYKKFVIASRNSTSSFSIGDMTTLMATDAENLPTTDATDKTMFSEVPCQIYSRKDWNALLMKSEDKLELPVKRIVIMDTQTEKCDDSNSCKDFLKSRQKSFIKVLLSKGFYTTDLPENFLIAPDGSIFEGRGFTYEGQHSYDQASTSYNSQAIGVTFIGNLTDIDLSSRQLEGFNYFIQKSVKEGQIKEDYQLYYREQLVGPNVISKKLQDNIKTLDHWKESMKNQVIHFQCKNLNKRLL